MGLTPFLVSALLAVANITSAAPSQAVDRRATAGCGKLRLYFGITQGRTIQSGGRERKYSIHLPWNYNRDNAYPVVLGFHGSGGVGFFFEADTKLSISKYSGDRILIYPDAFEGNWAGPSYASIPVADDLRFVDDLLNDVEANFCVDTRRVYATGISNGAGFVNDIACSQTGGRFAAFAPSSGSYYTDRAPNSECRPARSPLPMLSIHGGNDKSVSYTGGEGEGGILPPISDWLEIWASRNACGSSTKVDSFENRVHHTTWQCGNEQNALQHWKIDTMGHAWASTEPNFSQLAIPEGPTLVQGNDIIMEFFNQHSLP